MDMRSRMTEPSCRMALTNAGLSQLCIFVHVSGRADERQGGEQISGCYWANRTFVVDSCSFHIFGEQVLIQTGFGYIEST